MLTKSRSMLVAVALLAVSTSGSVFADEVSAECDGRQMYNYVDVALRSGGGVINVASDPSYGGSSVSLALKSQNMRIYSNMITDIREHDLSLARSGCKSLAGGPTMGMMSTLRQIDSKIKALVSSQYSEKGILTEGFGETR